MNAEGGIAAHTDFLNVTVPVEGSEEFPRAVMDACGHGAASEREGQRGIFDMYGGVGTMVLRRRGQVIVFGLSGGTLQFMREQKVFEGVLTTLLGFSHRVTLIDAAYDVAIEAPAVLERFFQEHKVHGVRLTSRAAAIAKMGWKVGVTGEETGTVYVGRRTAEVRAKLYDKRQERIDRGHGDPGPCLRYELTVTGKGADLSLRDAWDPTALFWRFMGGRVLPMPPGVPQWVPGGYGFELAKREELTPEERLQQFVDWNPNWPRLMALADACGPDGRKLLWRKIARYGVGRGEAPKVFGGAP